jgi:hypothetical protein
LQTTRAQRGIGQHLLGRDRHRVEQLFGSDRAAEDGNQHRAESQAADVEEGTAFHDVS